MPVEYEGNVLRPPGMTSPIAFAPPEEILAAYSPDPVKKGGTVQAGAGVLRVGEPMKFDGAGYLVKATSTYADAVCVNVTATDCTTEAHEINVLFGGCINAKVAAISTKEAALATALGGRYISQFGYIIF